MFVSFDKLPAEARVWVYQANKILDQDAIASVDADTREFLESWTSHQSQVLASSRLIHGLFLVIGADQAFNSTGGCSIDTKVRFVRSLGEKLGLSFFDRHSIAYVGPERVEIVSFNEFGRLLESGAVNDRTVVFNNLVSTVRELNENWQVPYVHSWQRNLLGV